MKGTPAPVRSRGDASRRGFVARQFPEIRRPGLRRAPPGTRRAKGAVLKREWWKRAFVDGAFPVEDLTRSEEFKERTKRDVPFILRALKLRRGDRLLDVCCGPGRVALPLARRGLRVTGVDASDRYLRTARKGRSGALFLKRDMRALGFSGEFDAAINLWTSFGYFERASDDLMALRSMRRALKPGGRLLLQTTNGARLRSVLSWLRDHEVPSDRWSEIAPGSLVLERPRLVKGDRVVENDWLIVKGGKKHRLISRVRLYDGASMGALLKKAGFTVEAFFGDADGLRYDPSDSLRLVVVARNPL
ncbi:MAG: hypothetical protein CO113_03785 [Elusimicrobia bacterium CG_4_9_14_3_um_filter_62_55]|nr:MAG: hypothetical protein CO113_03785 [Elusimicrobia bacterium CG_4_9_14_3_um_filter_62_55]